MLDWARFPKDQNQRHSIVRKVRVLRKDSWICMLEDPKQLSKVIEKEIASLFRNHQRKILKEWKAKASMWCASKSDVFKVLRKPSAYDKCHY